MTYPETCKLVAAVQALWPHQALPTDSPSVWHSVLERFEYEAADAAVREFAVQGRDFAPLVGQVVQLLTERVTDAPEWDEAWAEIRRLMRRYSPALPGREVPPGDAFSHELVAAFARPAWAELCMGPAPGTRDHGTHYAQQRDAYNAMRGRAGRAAGRAAIGAPRRSDLRRLAAPAAALEERTGGLLIGSHPWLDEGGAS